MRICLAVFLAAFVSLPLLAQPSAVRIEYGKPVELRNVKSVFLSSTAPDLKDEAGRQLSQLLPALTFAESEELADVTVSLTRKPAPEGPADAGVVTIAVVARVLSGGTIRLYLDASSRQKDVSEAVREVITQVVTLFQEVNPGRFGTPAKGTTPPNLAKPKVHTTAGLRPGLSRREVLAVLGAPTQVLKGSRSEVWMYRTSDGTMRLVFGGDFLVSAALNDKK